MYFILSDQKVIRQQSWQELFFHAKSIGSGIYICFVQLTGHELNMYSRKLLPILLVLIVSQTACSSLSGTTQTESHARANDSTAVQNGAREAETVKRSKAKTVNKTAERTREAQRPLETR